MKVPLWEYTTYDVFKGRDEDGVDVRLLVRQLNETLYRAEVEYLDDRCDDGECVEAEEYDAVSRQTLEELFEEFGVRKKTPIETFDVLEPVMEVEI